MLKKRLRKTLEELAKNHMEVFIISKPENQYYISGFTGEGLIILTNHKNYVITDSRYMEQAKNEIVDFEIIERTISSSTFSTAFNIIKELDPKRVGFESHFMTVKEYDELTKVIKPKNLIKGDGIIEKLRAIKDAYEIDLIKTAQKITDETFKHILNFIKPGTSELDLVAELEFYMKKKGSRGKAFRTVLVSGPRTALPHGIPSERKVQLGDLVTIDFGARFSGYCSDMTRTVIIGKPSERQKAIYNTVLDAQTKAIESIKPNTHCKDIDNKARSYICKQGFGKYFGHGLGHGVGLEIHETPSLSPKSDSKLLPGMVVTIEPGIYVEDYGGVRIEDMVVITKDGFENITSSKKRLIYL